MTARAQLSSRTHTPFQSRFGFSARLDAVSRASLRGHDSFNSVLGFRSVATSVISSVPKASSVFQSRGGFSVRGSDLNLQTTRNDGKQFQSRRGVIILLRLMTHDSSFSTIRSTSPFSLQWKTIPSASIRSGSIALERLIIWRKRRRSSRLRSVTVRLALFK